MDPGFINYRRPRKADKVLKRETRMVSTSFEKFKKRRREMGEFKEILMFCLMYSGVLLGALVLSFGPVPRAQKAKIRE